VNRRGIRTVLETDANLLVAAEVSSGHALLVACRSIRPDLVLVDLQLWLDAVDGLRVLRQLATETRVLLLGIGDDPTRVSAALSAGASGYLSKACRETDLFDAGRRGISYNARAPAHFILTWAWVSVHDAQVARDDSGET
jgi:DNA-binding NarL/FixJ family response regulator